MGRETGSHPSKAAGTLDEMMLFDQESLKCPYHYDQLLRDQAPVHRDPTSGVYTVSTYDLVREVHRSPQVFSNEFGLESGASGGLSDPDIKAAMRSHPNLGKGTLLTTDDPEHKVFRDLMKDFFTADNFMTYEPWIRDRARSLLDKLAQKQSCNFGIT